MEEDSEYSSFSTYNYTYWFDDISLPWKWEHNVLLVLALFGFALNMALLLVIVLNQHMRTVSNLLVANLAVADLIMFVFAVPYDVAQWYSLSWPHDIGGRALCKIGNGVWSLAQVLCVGSLTAVSIERYCSLRWRMKVKRTFLILGVVWLTSIVLSVPTMRYSTVQHFGKNVTFCFITPPWGSFGHVFASASYTVITYVLPVIVITCCYVGMASILARNASTDTATVRARRLLAVVILFLDISFIVCWFPVHFIDVYFLIADVISYDFYMFIVGVYDVGHVLIYVNSFLNPLVVFIMSGVHRKLLIVFFVKLKECPTNDHNDPYAQIQEHVSESETEHLDLEP